MMQMFQVDGLNSKVKRDAEAVGVGMKEIMRATRYTKLPEGCLPLRLSAIWRKLSGASQFFSCQRPHVIGKGRRHG